jgi:hypothetical protein
MADHPMIICYINPKHAYYPLKFEWLKQRFQEGLKIKLLYLEGEKKPVGFIEYVPGESCWRSVDAAGYMFIHCLWTYGKKYQHQGLGGKLLEEVEKDAKGMKGVAAMASDKPFMANRALFLKNGYVIADESGKDQLLMKPLKGGAKPSINNWQAELEKQQDLSIVYTKQCPWVARFMEEVKPIIEEKKLYIRITELTSASQAQKAPSFYSVFNLSYRGKLLADRYVSTTRFKNILEKDLKM